MDHREQDNRYEQLYKELFGRVNDFHEGNKRRIRRGAISLIILPVVLELIRQLTDSDKVFFLIIWIIAMFILCAFLISVEYIDDSIQKYLNDITDREASFDALVTTPDAISDKFRERVTGMYSARGRIIPRLIAGTGESEQSGTESDDASLTEGMDAAELVDEAVHELSEDEIEAIIEFGKKDNAAAQSEAEDGGEE